MSQPLTGVAQPVRRAVDDARAEALDREPAAIREERAWERSHPEGAVEASGERLVLSNFAVGEAELKVEHLRALEQFVAANRLGLTAGRQVAVVGNASPTGAEHENTLLAAARADQVKLRLSFMMLSQIGQGAPIAASGASVRRVTSRETGESLARERRVEVAMAARTASPTRIPAPPSVARDQESASNMADATPLVPSAVGRFVVTLPRQEFATSKFGRVVLSGEIVLVSVGYRREESAGSVRLDYRYDLASRLTPKLGASAAPKLALSLIWALTEGTLVGLQGRVELRNDPPFVWVSIRGERMNVQLQALLKAAGFADLANSIPIDIAIDGASLRVSYLPSADTLAAAARYAPEIARSAAQGVMAGGIPAASAAAGVALAYGGAVVAGLALIDADARRGQARADTYHLRRGYAAAVAGLLCGRPTSLDAPTPATRAAQEKGYAWIWVELAKLDPDAVQPLAQRLCGAAGGHPARYVFDLIGGAGNLDDPTLPTPDVLLSLIGRAP